ncbi:MAG: serine/threonine protein kinase [Gemmatimonadetes bacterium]|nr:serine/threonine protein kinase [Gemmatimonadota bacterium]
MSDDPITRLNAALEGRYSIERELGEGGMANVYLAEDLKHDRKVALKVLKSELAAVVGADRFLAEIKTTANLQHPHILPLFDSGEADGFLFYVMPYVEGETLRDRLDREHQLPVDDAVRIASDVAEALDYAHRQGVIHRDIKPANILLQDGKPVISDFGIALAVGAAGRGRLTETGLSLGTPHYMSPEQVTGDGQLGPTTDIYALGCVLYEMLAGQRPFAAPTPQAVLVKVLTSDPALITTIRRTVPSNVEAVLARALEKLPADRFESASAFNTALADPHFDVVRAQAEHARAPGRKRRAWRSVPILASLIVGLVVGRIWMGWSSGSAPEGTRLLRLTEMYGMEETPAVSPDGQHVAFIGRARAGDDRSSSSRWRPVSRGKSPSRNTITPFRAGLTKTRSSTFATQTKRGNQGLFGSS